LKLKWCTK